MNTFYNGLPVTKENLLSMIKECMEEGWKNSDLHRETEEVDVEIIISTGQWFFQQED